MKAFVNLLIDTDAYDDPEKLADAVIAECEEEGIKVIWHAAREGRD